MKGGLGARGASVSERSPVQMKIVLQKTVERLGDAGDVADVADRYARNFLIPAVSP